LAKIHRLLLSIYESFGDDAKIDHILDELDMTIRTGQDLLDFPFEFLSEIIQELDKLYADNKKLDQVFEAIVGLTENRTSKGAAGCLLL